MPLILCTASAVTSVGWKPQVRSVVGESTSAPALALPYLRYFRRKTIA